MPNYIKKIFLILAVSSLLLNCKDNNDNNTLIDTKIVSVKPIVKDSINVQSTIDQNTTNTIETISIGRQTWTLKNLNVSTFRNGDTIYEAKSKEEWISASKLRKPAFCYYNNEPKNGQIYGKLYNFYAVADVRGLAPVGYRVPSKYDVNDLFSNIGASNWSDNLTESKKAAVKLRSQHLWIHESSTNESKFNALPAGIRYDFGAFSDINEAAYFYIADHISPSRLIINTFAASGWSGGGTLLGSGYSVRCLKGESNMPIIKISQLENELIQFDYDKKPRQGDYFFRGEFGIGSITEKHFIDGLQQGVNKGYDAGKRIKLESNYKDGLLDGKYTTYNESAEFIDEVGNYIKEKKEGEWITYAYNTVPNQVGYLMTTKKKEYYENGKLTKTDKVSEVIKFIELH